jgi:4-hydroxybenzoate polyprenyltransferase
MKGRTLLELGRVSNLPTVWSNVACGAALSGAPMRAAPLVLVAFSGSLFYVGGMLLNDAFDAEIDRRERPERPIPSGRATLAEVYGVGFGMLAAGLVLLAVGAALGVSPAGIAWPLAGLGTALAVVAYNRWHKGYAWSPVVMGLCRAGLYALGAFAVSATPHWQLIPAAICLLLYIVGLTHIARFETASVVGKTWPVLFLFAPLIYGFAHPALRISAATAVPLVACMMFSAASTLRALGFAKQGGRCIGRAVVSLIAGISLVDAVFAACAGANLVVVASFLATALTFAGQKKIRGT